MKICNRCKVEKSVSEFQKDSHRPEGIRNACKDCVNAKLREYRAANPEKIAEQKRGYWVKSSAAERPKRKARYEKNKERENSNSLEYYRSNKEDRTMKHKTWVENNKEQLSAYRRANLHRSNSNNASRRAKKLQATPSWANQKYIDIFYQFAKDEATRVGKPVHVDHIVPLVSDKVCGLHNEFNLQLMIGKENLSKGNKTWPDMWD